jgi:beta-lactamase regulating signal transducer with metallopeptidase domain
VIAESFVIPPQSLAEPTTGAAQFQLPDTATALFCVWVVGIFVFLALSIIRYIRFSRELKSRATPATENETVLLKELSGMERIPQLYRSPIAPAPMLIGLLRPSIVLPDSVYTDTQLRNILLHELTHLRRRDVIVKWVSALVGALHWFNPIVHLLRREINLSCELACDETIIRSLDKDGKLNYGNTLIAVVATHRLPYTALSTRMCEEKKALKERLGTIMKHKSFSRMSIVLSCILLAAVVCGTIVLGASNPHDSDVPDLILIDEPDSITDYSDDAGLDSEQPDTTDDAVKMAGWLEEVKRLLIDSHAVGSDNITVQVIEDGNIIRAENSLLQLYLFYHNTLNSIV